MIPSPSMYTYMQFVKNLEYLLFFNISYLTHYYFQK